MDFSDITNNIYSTLSSNMELNNLDKEIEREIQYEQLETVKSIAENAALHVDLANKEIEVLKEQLSLAKNDSRSAKKRLAFQKSLLLSLSY